MAAVGSCTLRFLPVSPHLLPVQRGSFGSFIQFLMELLLASRSRAAHGDSPCLCDQIELLFLSESSSETEVAI
jgi:hypothetical protein